MAIGSRRVFVGAHYGLRDWLVQRVTALVLIAFVLLVAGGLALARRLDYEAWAGIFAPVPMKLVTVLAVIALCYHAWIGVRDIWMDYIKPAGLRLALHVGTIVWLLYCLVWCIQILWSV
ncbi:MAG TPA: succinate dehydrogenase, hydrophobic membrane anchor protein [Burkholderiaceae bacterium]|nr:succinate dehydrogenase, hydrophobic membrane anchor protein [Burkholderiaceae bacterium]